MLKILIEKELKAIITSPKFVGTFAICTVLLLLSVFIGVREYKASVRQYETATQLADQQLRETSSYRAVQTSVFRRPEPLQIFVSGLSYDIGRWASISQFETAHLRNSAYSDDPIFAVFRFIDLVFIVTVVLSLFAIMFTYDAICGERESGTLALTFSNPVPRAQYLLAKGIGAWLALTVPVSLAIMLCLLLVLIAGVPFTSAQWMATLVLMGMSLLFFTCFLVLGLLISALTRRSSVSFLIGLVVWVGFVLILPRAGVLAAGQIVRVPAVAEIEGERDAFAKDRWLQHRKAMEDFWSQHGSSADTTTDEEMWQRMQVQDSMFKAVQRDITAYEGKLYEALRQKRAEQERLAFVLSRISPVSAYQLAAMSLAGTDLAMKATYEDAMNTYRTAFTEYTARKQAEAGTTGGLAITFNSNTGFKIGDGRDKTALDFSDRPLFSPPERTLGKAAADTVINAGLLGLYSLLAFAGAFVAFLRYDVR